VESSESEEDLADAVSDEEEEKHGKKKKKKAIIQSKYWTQIDSTTPSTWVMAKLDKLVEALGSFGIYRFELYLAFIYFPRWEKMAMVEGVECDVVEMESVTYNLVTCFLNIESLLITPLHHRPITNLVDYLARDVENSYLSRINPQLKPIRSEYQGGAVLQIAGFNVFATFLKILIFSGLNMS
jgi:hypothetical protein